MTIQKWKTLCQKEKLLVLSNFCFCDYVFKKPSAAEASESIYMRERVKQHLLLNHWTNFNHLHRNDPLVVLFHVS